MLDLEKVQRAIINGGSWCSAQAKSVHEYLSKQNDKFSKMLGAITDITDDPTQTVHNVMYNNELNYNNRIQINENTLVPISDLLTSIKNHELDEENVTDTITINNVDYSMDEIAQYLNSQATVSTVCESAASVLTDKSKTPAEQAQLFYDKINLQLSSITGDAAATAQNMQEIIEDSSLSLADKVKSMLESIGINSSNATADSTDIGFPSAIKDATGASPIGAWVSGIEIPPGATVAQAIGTGIKTVAKTIGSLFGSFVRGVGSLVQKGVSWISNNVINADDVEVNDNYDDDTFDFGASFKLPLTATLRTTYAALLNKLSTSQYLQFPLATFNVYLWKEVNANNVDSAICMHVRIIPLSKSTYTMIMDSLINAVTIDDASDAFQYIAQNSIEKDADDVELMRGILAAKNVFYAYTYLVKYDWDVSTIAYWVSDMQSRSNPWNAMNDPQGSPAYWYRARVTVTSANCTNIDFINELGSFSYGDDYNSTTGYLDFNNYSKSILDFVSDVIATQDSNTSVTYIPYCHTQSYDVGKWRIKTDSEHAQFFSKILKTVLVIAVAVVGVKVVLKVKKSLRMRAIKANVAASNEQQHLSELLKGTTLPSGEIVMDDEAIYQSSLKSYKLVRKFNFLNKLSGGFATATTGIANYASSSSEFSGLRNLAQPKDSSDYTVQQVIKVIKG